MWLLEAMEKKQLIEKEKEQALAKLMFYAYLLTFVGLPYRWAGDDPMEGFDCSGAAQEWLSYFGIDPDGDQTANDLFVKFYNDQAESIKDIGSLAFYGRESKITHIAMFIDNERVIEFGGGNSKTIDLDMAIKQNAFGRIRKYDHRSDLVAIIKPRGLPW